MRLLPLLRVGLVLLTLAGQLYAPVRPAPRVAPRPAPRFVPHPEPRIPREAPKPHERERSVERTDSSHPTDVDPHRSADVKIFEFVPPSGERGTEKDQAESKPFVYCALPTGLSFENVFGDRFSAAKAEQISEHQLTALGIKGARTSISNDFRRHDLLARIADHRGQRPFILVCHSEGLHENREIPLGDSPGAKIAEDELRAVCAANDTELFLVSCQSKDLKISQDISYGEAFRIVKLAMDISAASTSPLTVAQLKAILVETAQKQLTPGDEFRISFGADVKKVIIVTATSSGGGTDEGWDGVSCFTIVLGLVAAIFLIRWLYRRRKGAS
jgi:hypothetical protein